MAMACLLGHRFSTLTMLEQFIPYQQDLVRLYGFESKCASVRAININVEEAATHRERTLRDLSVQVKELVSRDQAEVVILACAGLCGYDEALSELSGVPVIDLGARRGQPPAQIGRRSCVVVVEAAPPGIDTADGDDADHDTGETLVVGLLVDAVYEVFDAPPGHFEPVPPLGTRIDASYLMGMSRVRGEVIGVLALDRVLAQQELTALIAERV